jgi:hypothetical protein
MRMLALWPTQLLWQWPNHQFATIAQNNACTQKANTYDNIDIRAPYQLSHLPEQQSQNQSTDHPEPERPHLPAENKTGCIIQRSSLFALKQINDYSNGLTGERI